MPSPDQPTLAALERPAVEVAPLLLGWTLRHHSAGGMVTIRLTETEAYQGQRDPASHAYRGRAARNQVMFGPAGRLYVYLSYGVHHCCNVVTGPDGEGSAVLLRAGEVVSGLALARRRRGSGVPDRFLARGPGCLTQALGIDRTHNGGDLLSDGGLELRPAEQPTPAERISRGPRVGISVAADVAWRFWLTGDPTVSAYKRSPRGADRPASGPD